jgi:integrase
MNKKVITEAVIKRFPTPEKQVEQFDAALAGFALRVTPKDTKSFVFFYRYGGKQRRATLGRWPVVTLAEARKRAEKILKLVNEGTDPRVEEKNKKARRISAQDYTYEIAVEEFIQKYAIDKKKSRRWKDQKLLLMNAGKKLDTSGRPDKNDRGWADLPVAQITGEHVYDALDTRLSKSPYAANRTYEVLCVFFRWHYRRGLVPQNPMDKVDKPFDGEKPRDRFWSNNEIKALWQAADKLNEPWPSYLKLLIVMGQRKNEIASMRWGGLDLEEGVWELPEDQHKGKRGHKFPLPPLAIRILKGIPRVGENPYVFPGRLDNRPMTVGSHQQTRIRNLSSIADFTFHAARHTLGTNLQDLKVPPHIISECLAHARQGVTARHYGHYDYLDEQREAFEAWASHVEKLIYPDGVVGLHG